MRRSFVLTLVALATITFPRTGTAIERRVLIPLLANAEGPSGAYFVSDLAILNKGVEETVVTGIGLICPVPCPPTDPPQVTLAPGWVTAGFLPTGTPGRIVGVNSDSVAFNLRVRQYEELLFRPGVDIPVVPTTQFRTEPIHFFQVWNREGLRTRLRVYALEETSVRVRILREADNFLLSEEVVNLAAPRDAWEPAFGQTTSLPATISALRIEVSPSNPGIGIWARLSITSNANNEITIVTPKCGEITSGCSGLLARS
jgi:hypothetical protein